MGKRGIGFIASIALIALSGCATHQRTDAVTRSTESDVRPAALPTNLVGTWSGSFWPIAADAGGSNAIGQVTLAIKDDGSYTLTERRGASTRNYSGVVVANGRTITLRSSSGGWFPLRHRGNARYGLASDPLSGFVLHISVEKG